MRKRLWWFYQQFCQYRAVFSGALQGDASLPSALPEGVHDSGFFQLRLG